MFNRENVRNLHLEVTSVCNAACPMCLRETDKNFNKETDSISLSLEKIKNLFEEKFIANLNSMQMCGTYGDPAAAPDCLSIYNYFRKINPNIELGMHSNGSLKSTYWWAELGKILSQKNDYCYFGIDGLSDTNHIYRVNTDFNKIMKNCSAFIKAGGKAYWEFLVFEHNEHQVEDAKKLSKEMGFVEFREKVTRRFGLIDIPFLKPPKGEKYK